MFFHYFLSTFGTNFVAGFKTQESYSVMIYRCQFVGKWLALSLFILFLQLIKKLFNETWICEVMFLFLRILLNNVINWWYFSLSIWIEKKCSDEKNEGDFRTLSYPYEQLTFVLNGSSYYSWRSRCEKQTYTVRFY